ncbi:MAG: YheC/YheD family protein [Chitinophagales bacterium]
MPPTSPVIGILSTSFQRQGKVMPRGIQAELAYLTQIGRKMPGIVCVFSPYSIDWNKGLIQGCRFREELNGSGYWECETFPMPSVVYDQMYANTAGSHYHQIKNRLKQVTGGRYFNSKFMNKLTIHRLLNRVPLMQEYLPKTKRFRSAADLVNYLSCYDSVYLKPAAGGMGWGIIKVSKYKNGYRYQTRNGYCSPVYNIDRLYKKIKQLMGKHLYLIQQGLNLFRYKDQIVDIRVLIQKNGRGIWSLTKLYTRVGKPGRITSNLAGGATAFPLGDILSWRYSKPEIEDIRSRIIDLSLNACQVLEQESQELIGEIGVDIGLDDKNRLWIIELNLKPRKSTTGSGNQRLIGLSFAKPLRFAGFLAKQKTIDPQN